MKIDYVGFLLTAIGLAGLLVTLNRGQSENWFDSDLIIATTAMAVFGLGSMVVWELNHQNPIVPLLRIPNFAISVTLLLGLLVFGTILIIPQMLQQVFHYTAYEAGLALTIGGAIAIVMMPLSGVMISKVDARFLLFPAFAMQAFAFWYFSGFSTQSTFYDAATGRFFMSVALPFLFIPVNTVAYVGLPPGDSDEASAMLNFFRNLGGAFGSSITQTLLVRREQFHRITEGLNPLNPVFENARNLLQHSLWDGAQALGVIYSQVQEQADILAYVDVFYVLMWAVVCVLPSVLLLRTGSSAPY